MNNVIPTLMLVCVLHCTLVIVMKCSHNVSLSLSNGVTMGIWKYTCVFSLFAKVTYQRTAFWMSFPFASCTKLVFQMYMGMLIDPKVGICDLLVCRVLWQMLASPFSHSIWKSTGAFGPKHTITDRQARLYNKVALGGRVDNGDSGSQITGGRIFEDLEKI